MMPDCNKPIWQTDRDIHIPEGFLSHRACRVPLDSISELKRRMGDDAAVCGKVFGPWTLGYHTFGIESFLMNTLLAPDMIRRVIEKLTEVTLRFARAQIDAGADCLLIGDHATRDLCSPEMYREFLKPIHENLVAEIEAPLILHICGDTSDRIDTIAETGVHCFHWDTKLGSSRRARELAGDSMALMGGVSNPELLAGTQARGAARAAQSQPGHDTIESRIERAVIDAVESGIDIVAPECAVPLDAPMDSIKAIARSVPRRGRGR